MRQFVLSLKRLYDNAQIDTVNDAKINALFQAGKITAEERDFILN